MSNASSPTSPSKKGWRPYQCPACFSLFRARRSRSGQVGECPSCQEKVRLVSEATTGPVAPQPIPAVADRGVPLDIKKAEIIEPTENEKDDSADWQDDGRKRRRRHSRGAGGSDINWEESREREQKKFPWMTIVSVLTGILFVVAAGSFWMKSRPQEKNDDKMDIIVGTEEDMQEIAESLALTKDVKKEIDDSATEIVSLYEKFDLPTARKVIQNFLNAPTVEERAKFVRDREQVFPTMRSYYAKRGYEAEGYNKLDDRKVSYRDNFLSATVILADYSSKPIAVEMSDSGYLVDWGSWAGASEIEVSELMEKKPTGPVELRIRFRPLDYYNYHFADDTEWVSYRLSFSSAEEFLWGYAPRNSQVHKDLGLLKTSSIIVKVKYPSDARSKDQVEIVEVVTSGWVKE